MARPRPARLQSLLAGLDRLYPRAECELRHGDPWQLLVATMLSAQCTDKKVNEVTPRLFLRFGSAGALGAADPAEVEEIVRPTGFYRNKARAIIAASRLLRERWGGRVPRTMEELLELPGVARKTANVVLGSAYGIASGVVVDTHVQRIAARLGLTRNQDPGKIELDLQRILPRERWVSFSHQLIWHGRRVCFARNPDCEHCALAPACPSAMLAGGARRRPRPARSGA